MLATAPLICSMLSALPDTFTEKRWPSTMLYSPLLFWLSHFSEISRPSCL